MVGYDDTSVKNLKGLKKENLRDNMSTLELALNMLAEATTTELTKTQNPYGLQENREVAQSGGKLPATQGKISKHKQVSRLLPPTMLQD